MYEVIIITKEYYVYERFRLDNMTCFYVGKGKGRRYKEKKRNSHHDSIARKYGYLTIIFKDNLTEEEALDLEKQRIFYYVFDLGYGIDIDGFRNGKSDRCLTNSTFGGEGTFGLKHTDDWKKQQSERMSGENNPMYGIDVFHRLPVSEQNRIRVLKHQLNSGENNPMYGISPKERMSESVYEGWVQKRKDRDVSGSNNPNYHNKTLHNKVKDNKSLRIQYYSRPKEQNGRARRIFVYDQYGNFVNEFSYIGQCAEWLKETLSLKSKISSIRSSIITSITKNKSYMQYNFSYDMK